MSKSYKTYSDEKYELTDKQRKWLESLSDADKEPYPITVNAALANGYYSEFGQATLRRLVVHYKKRHNL